MKRHFLKLFTLIPCALLLASCASIVDGTHQNLAVSTSPVTGAQCDLSNSKGHWTAFNTPSNVEVHRASTALQIMCKKPGYVPGQKVVRSETKGMVAGNLLFGGLIGGGVDVADGAAFHYPSQIHVSMHTGKGSVHTVSKKKIIQAKKTSLQPTTTSTKKTA